MQRLGILPRTDWQDTAKRYGFQFHTMDGRTYWDESAYYAFSLEEIERDLEAPTEELHAMAMDLVGEVVASESLMTRLAIPKPFWDWIASSWRSVPCANRAMRKGLTSIVLLAPFRISSETAFPVAGAIISP